VGPVAVHGVLLLGEHRAGLGVGEGQKPIPVHVGRDLPTAIAPGVKASPSGPMPRRRWYDG
jgi:hypothetical protein